ncbi:hypothetical protein DV736_g5686, partial [Chaetothyriales sp. CBS 134916]
MDTPERNTADRAIGLPSEVLSVNDPGSRTSPDLTSPRDELEAEKMDGASSSSPLTGQANPHAAMRRRTKPWISWKLSWWFALLLAVVDVALIAALIVLDRISHRNQGIIDVPQFANPSLLFRITNVQQYYGMLWTTLPSLIFTIFALFWAAVVGSVADRQPFVELHRGSTARRTILLDYRTYPSVYSWAVAFRNLHPHVALAMLLSLVVSVAFGPLSAHLLVTQSAYPSHPLTLTNLTYLDFNAIGSTTNLQSFIDVATAVHAYDSAPAPWMTNEYAFNRFTLPSSSGTVNISAPTIAYSGLLDCQTIPQSQYKASVSNANGGLDLKLTFTDRDCSITETMPVSSTEKVYAKTYFKSTCAYHTEASTPINRFILLSGLYSSASPILLSPFSITSCIPTYWSTTGLLTLSHTQSASSSDPGFVSFTNTTSTQLYPDLSVVFEEVLTQYSVFDASASTYTDAIGFGVYSTALAATNQSSPTQAMSSDIILSSLENMWATIYASLARSVLIQPVSSLPPSTSSSHNNYTNIPATMTHEETRLFVARPIAYTLIAILILVLMCDVFLFYYTCTHHTPMLTAEPVGLLGNAVLLRDSHDLFDMVDNVEALRETGETRKGVVEYVKDRYGGGKGESCRWVDGDGHGHGPGSDGDGDNAHGGHGRRARTAKGGILTDGLTV